jgi:spore coat polysaccharide biosynthesis protein SpsF
MIINAIVASRMTSSRLPGKILKNLAGKPALEQLVDRLRKSKYLNQIVIATTTNMEDNIVAATAGKLEIPHYRGSEWDVLARTVEAAEAAHTDIIVQITSDCPLIDAETVDRVIERFLEHPYLDYVSNGLIHTYPIGFSVEVFRTKTLREIANFTQDPADREHVSLYMYEHPRQYHLSNIEAPRFLRHPEYRLTLDTLEDYQLISFIYDALYNKKNDFDLYDITHYLLKNPSLSQINIDVIQKKARP